MAQRGVAPWRRSLTPLLRDVGGILLVGSLVMVTCALVAGLYRDWWTGGWFVVSAAVTAGVGALLARVFRTAPELRQRDALAIAGGAWLAMAVFGAAPFLLAAHLTPPDVIASYLPAGADHAGSLPGFRDPWHALFESMSGWTTTGLTMAVHEPSMPEAFLFYRSLMQWTGGAGIIVLALTVIQQHGGVGGVYLYRAEGRQDRLRPSIAETVRRVWRIYVAITAALVVYLFVATLVLLPDRPVTTALFDAVNHAMAGQSTGGFSTLDRSIAGYGSYAMELVHLLPMLSGAIALPVHYVAIRERRPSAYLRDVQNRTMIGLLVVGSPMLIWALGATTAVTDPAREGVFQFVSALSTTGWQTSDIANWRPSAVLIVVAAMVVGGSAGATVGGIKLLRVIQLFTGARWHVTRFFSPSSAVHYFRIGDRNLDQQELETETGNAALFTLLWVVGLFVSVLVMTATLDGTFSLADMIFESATAQGTVGLTSGITAPDMPRAVEVTFIAQMWLGRLEIIPVLVFVRTLLLLRR